MSTAMNFGTKSFQPRPPDKGSFPWITSHFMTKIFEQIAKLKEFYRELLYTYYLSKEDAVFFFILGECKGFKEKFMKCLRDNNFENSLCRNESKDYLQCRMERQLMAQEPLEKLGFGDMVDGKSEAKNKS